MAQKRPVLLCADCENWHKSLVIGKLTLFVGWRNRLGVVGRVEKSTATWQRTAQTVQLAAWPISVVIRTEKRACFP
jgi:hypothetical protein